MNFKELFKTAPAEQLLDLLLMLVVEIKSRATGCSVAAKCDAPEACNPALAICRLPGETVETVAQIAAAFNVKRRKRHDRLSRYFTAKTKERLTPDFQLKIDTTGTAVATMYRTTLGDYIVLAGSLMAKTVTSKEPENIERRNHIIQQGWAVPTTDGRYYVLACDVRFDSSSGAGSTMCGHTLDGPLFWRIPKKSSGYPLNSTYGEHADRLETLIAEHEKACAVRRKDRKKDREVLAEFTGVDES